MIGRIGKARRGAPRRRMNLKNEQIKEKNEVEFSSRLFVYRSRQNNILLKFPDFPKVLFNMDTYYTYASIFGICRIRISPNPAVIIE